MRSSISLGLLLFASLSLLADDEITENKPPTEQEITQIIAKSAQLLDALAPKTGSALDKAARPLRILKTEGSTVHWGNLFGRAEIVALTNLAPPIPAENDWDHPPQYLTLFAWVKDHWVYRQFLGDAYDLEFHQHDGTYFLQASFQVGRYGGECLSWMMDAETKKLIPTHFEDSGPFYIAGDYLVCTRGFERLHHDTSYVIYRYRDRHEGALVARLHENDNGRFDITFRNTRSGKWEVWNFTNRYDAPFHYSVQVTETRLQDAQESEPLGEPEATPPVRSAEWNVREDQPSESVDYFQLLTGLNRKIVDNKWLERLPKEAPLKFSPIEATGDPAIISRLKGKPDRR